MKLSATRAQVLNPLQSVIGVVERRQTMPILANVLLSARNNRLSITGTDLEVELVASSEAGVQQAGDLTVPGRKLLDIFRALPEDANVTMATEGERMIVRAGRSRFTLSSLPAAEYPVVEEINAQWYDENYWTDMHAEAAQIDALIDEFNAATGLVK